MTTPKFKPEMLALCLNLCILALYIARGREIGKIIYWIGAIILTIGLLIMRG